MTSIAHGLCHCGCGQPAPIAKQSRTDRGWVKGEPKRYIARHYSRASSPTEYVVDPATGCWLWTRCISAKGYGRKGSSHGSTRDAHVVYWERTHAPVPAGMELHHKCETKRCVNPDHLEPLTRREHMERDGRLEEFRSRLPFPPRPQKLTPEQVYLIRSASGSQVAIGARFGISNVMVGRIQRREAWATLPERDAV